MMRYLCCDERRRAAVAGRPGLNGLDYLEVVDTEADPLGPMLTTLAIHFINPAPLPPLTPADIAITGGGSIRGIRVVATRMVGPILVVSTDRPGDFSIYQLTLSAAPGMDPILSSIDFSFRPGCDSDFDVAAPLPCPSGTPAAPPIDYLARDYTSLRQLLLDRVAVLGAPLPGDDPADLGVTLVELLATIGDQISYRQDAIATEATLQNARQRISARRHARLVDYVMHNGCNARAWVALAVSPADGAGPLPPAAPIHLPAGTPLLTRTPGLPSLVPPTSPAWAAAIAQGTQNQAGQIFETMEPIDLYPMLGTLRFHAWGGRECCLPRGATSATLRDDLTAILAPGRVLVFREMLDPATGDPLQADPAHRCAVRLTSVTLASDPIGGLFDDPPTAPLLAVTEIAWGPADALPFPVCVSAILQQGEGSVFLRDVSTACGNIVLADHGLTLPAAEDLGTVPPATLTALAATRPAETLIDEPTSAGCAHQAFITIPPRYNPVLAEAPLTHAAPYGPTPPVSAAASTLYAPADARPVVFGVISTEPDSSAIAWTLQYPDLVEAELEPVFTVEVDNDLRGHLRFGDNTRGRRPSEGATFSARYRIGNGTAGNVGAGTIAHIAAALGGVTLVPDNPMPATGGAEAETIESVRRRAPFAFRVQERAVTPADYADQCRRLPGVQRAAATLRWTGSWHTHFVAVDQLGVEDLAPAAATALATALEPIRLAGHDLQIVQPTFVALEIELDIHVAPFQFRAAVRQALLAFLNAQPGGVFEPDNFTFGQNVYLSPILAAAQDVPGVDAVTAAAFRRFSQPATEAAAAGVLAIGPNEIARLDNDPNYPDRGVLRLVLSGGR